MAKDTGHRWKFFRAGGFDQVRLDTGEDLLALADLDQKLWVALSCPVHGLEFDAKTLELIDTDKDGRIRVPEILAAVKWAGSVLKSADSLVKRRSSLPLAAIDGESEEGKRLLSSARQILRNLDKSDAKEITLEDTADTAKIFAATRFNGDGIVPVASAEDAALQRTIQDIIDCIGAATDRSGAPGVSQTTVDTFFAEAEAFSTWWAAAEADAANVLPLGDHTAAAADEFRAVAAKIDDYFARTRLVAFDERAAGPLNRDPAEYVPLAVRELSATVQEVASFPLARVEANRALPLRAGLNPAWADAMAKLVADVIRPTLGDKAELTDTEWRSLSARFDAFEKWRATKAGAGVEKLGLARVREILAAESKARIDALIVEDKALEPEANAIDSVDKLIRYHRDLHTLLGNFVSFSDFYSRKRKALFQAGTLYLDARSCDLCIRVGDPAAHAALATLSGTYLVYCECSRKVTGEKMFIVAALTGGDADELMLGRNGIFYDRKGNDWDATVIKLVQHPISVREAFFLPYKRVAKMIGEQFEKFASSRDKDVSETAASHIADPRKTLEGVPVAMGVAPAPGPAAPGKPLDIGTLAAIGLTLGALSTAFAAVATGFLALAWWKMPMAIMGVMLAISGPSMLLAWLKLRRRNIGPLLDANGWAVNARAKLNIPFGESLTSLAALPLNAERSLEDPFAEPKPKWRRYVFLVVVIAALGAAWRLGYLAIVWNKLSKPVVVPVPAAASAVPSGQ